MAANLFPTTLEFYEGLRRSIPVDVVVVGVLSTFMVLSQLTCFETSDAFKFFFPTYSQIIN